MHTHTIEHSTDRHHRGFVLPGKHETKETLGVNMRVRQPLGATGACVSRRDSSLSLIIHNLSDDPIDHKGWDFVYLNLLSKKAATKCITSSASVGKAELTSSRPNLHKHRPGHLLRPLLVRITVDCNLDSTDP